MSFILDIPDLDPRGPYEEIKRRRDAYKQYLESIRGSLPESAYAFATAAPFRRDGSLHDSWVEALTISESSSGERSHIRRAGIRVRLLGAWHDGYIRLRYEGVRRYSLVAHDLAPGPGTAHGDWLAADEVRLSEAGLVEHEVRFSSGARWLIECADIEHGWEPRGPRNPGRPPSG
jgi:hypothetical protein